MENPRSAQARIQARDAALRLLNQMTMGVAFTAVAGVGLLGVVSAQTNPATAAETSTTSTSTSTTTTSGGLQSTPAPTSSSPGGGVAVSGGS